MKIFHSFPSLSFKEHRLVYEEVPNNNEVPVVSAESSKDSVDPERAVDDAIQNAQTDILYLQKNMAAVDNVKNPDAQAQYQRELDRAFFELNSVTNQKQVLRSTTKATPPENGPAKSPSTTAPSAVDTTPSKQTEEEKKDDKKEERKDDDAGEKKGDKKGESGNAEKSDDKKEDATESIKEDLEEKGVDAENAERIAKETEDVLKDGKDGNKESNEKIENREQLAKAVAQNPHALEVFQELSQKLALGTGLSQRELLVGDSIVTHIALYDKNMAKEKVDELRPKNPQETTEFIEMVVQNAPASSKEKNGEQKDTSKETIEDDKARESRLYQEVRGDGTKGNVKKVSDVILEKENRIYEIKNGNSDKNNDTPESIELQKDIDTLKNLESKTKKLANDVDEKIRDMGQDIKDLDQESFADQLNVFTIEHDGSLSFKIKPNNAQKVENFVEAQLGEKASKLYQDAVKQGHAGAVMTILKQVCEKMQNKKTEQGKK